MDDDQLEGVIDHIDPFSLISADTSRNVTSSPFYMGSIDGMEGTYGFHAVDDESSGEKEVPKMFDMVHSLVPSQFATFFLYEDEVFNSLPAQFMDSSQLRNDFLMSHALSETCASFESMHVIKTLANISRVVNCDYHRVQVSGVRILRTFVHMSYRIYIVESTLPYMWMKNFDVPRRNQVRDRRILPNLTINSYKLNSQSHSVHLEVKEHLCDFTVPNSVTPSQVVVRNTAPDTSTSDISGCKIVHNLLHSGYKDVSTLVIRIEDSFGSAIMYKHFDIHLHNSSHTLRTEEQEWRNSYTGSRERRSKTASMSLCNDQAVFKDISSQTVCHMSIIPLSRPLSDLQNSLSGRCTDHACKKAKSSLSRTSVPKPRKIRTVVSLKPPPAQEPSTTVCAICACVVVEDDVYIKDALQCSRCNNLQCVEHDAVCAVCRST